MNMFQLTNGVTLRLTTKLFVQTFYNFSVTRKKTKTVVLKLNHL